jgi:hypothetical protein
LSDPLREIASQPEPTLIEWFALALVIGVFTLVEWFGKNMWVVLFSLALFCLLAICVETLS